MTVQQPNIILTPNLYSQRVIRQYRRKPMQFSCYANADYEIELWTNMSQKGIWIGLPFLQHPQRRGYYQLYVNTFRLIPGHYAYTLRYRPVESEEEWSWYGQPDNNGEVYIVAPKKERNTAAPTFASVPGLRFVAKEHHSSTAADLWHFRTQKNQPYSFSLGKLNHSMHRHVCLIRKGSTWLTSVPGKTDFQNRHCSERCQALLYQDRDAGNMHLWMAVSQSSDCWLSFGTPADNSSNMHDTLYLNHTEEEEEAHLLIVSTTKQHGFAHLLRVALGYYEQSIKKSDSSSAIKTAKDNDDDDDDDDDDDLTSKLGYCTWNAFGQEVDIAKIHSALSSLQENKIPVGYLLLDDGWQDVSSERRLKGFDACLRKFPAGLGNTVSQLKSDYPFLQCIGVWHTLWGYWNGIDKELAKHYSWKSIADKKTNIAIGLVEDSKAFYTDFYQFFAKAGVDFVKVDNQGSFQDLCVTEEERMGMWDSYRRQMVACADVFLQSRVVHCMSLTPHILFDPILSSRKKQIFRNSDDFFPDERDSHSWHIYANAINALWTVNFPAVGDWDMFQSDHPFAEYHASSRAISGGPIYITDPPNKHNTKLIYKLLGETKCHGYTILRSHQEPQPTFDTVFNNNMDTHSLITLYNLHQSLLSDSKAALSQSYYGICGFWNTGEDEKLGTVSSDLFCSRKLARMPTVAYVLSGPDRGTLVYLDPSYDPEEDEGEVGDGSGSTTSKLSFSSPSPSSSPSSSSSSSSSSSAVSSDSEEGHLSSEMTMIRVGGFGSSLVSVSSIVSEGLLSIACLGLIDKFNSIVAILSTRFVKRTIDRRPYYMTYEARLSHRSSSCGFWIKTHYENSRRGSNGSRKTLLVDLMPSRVRVDGYTLDPKTDWKWSCLTGLLTVDTMAVPKESLLTNSDDFLVEIDIDKTS